MTLEERAIRADQKERQAKFWREVDERTRRDAVWAERSKEVEAVARSVHRLLAGTEFRRDVVERAFELGGWCVHCGYPEPLGSACQCWNDE